MKTYFVVFKKQEGEIEPPYSYLSEDGKKSLKKHIDWSIEVEPRLIRTPEETKAYLEQYKNRK